MISSNWNCYKKSGTGDKVKGSIVFECRHIAVIVTTTHWNFQSGRVFVPKGDDQSMTKLREKRQCGNDRTDFQIIVFFVLNCVFSWVNNFYYDFNTAASKGFGYRLGFSKRNTLVSVFYYLCRKTWGTHMDFLEVVHLTVP